LGRFSGTTKDHRIGNPFVNVFVNLFANLFGNNHCPNIAICYVGEPSGNIAARQRPAHTKDR